MVAEAKTAPRGAQRRLEAVTNLLVSQSRANGRWYITYGGVRVGSAKGYGTKGGAERAIAGLTLYGR